MKIHILLLASVVITVFDAAGQCGVSVISYADPVWCQPCNGQAITASSGTSPYTYLWTTGDSTFSVDSLCAGTHVVTMTDSTGCIAVDSIELTQWTELTVTITTTQASCSTCNDGCMTITPSDGCGGPYTINTIPWDPFFTPCQAFPGTYVIEVCDDCNCCIQDTAVVDSGLVGIDDKLSEISDIVVIYPNPIADNGFNISYELLRDSYVQFRLYDYTGKEIKQMERKELSKGKHQEHINTGQWSPGIYFLVANINGQFRTVKFLKM